MFLSRLQYTAYTSNSNSSGVLQDSANASVLKANDTGGGRLQRIGLRTVCTATKEDEMFVP